MKRNPEKNRFVANGEEMIRSSETYRKKEEEIRNRIYGETLQEWILTPWWKKPLLKWRIERGIRKELDRLAPPDALYLSSNRKTETCHPAKRQVADGRRPEKI